MLNIAREIQDISSASRTLRKNVEEISNYLDNFSDASSHIVNIADQTNLISLNAAIEAARAGEEGKSFSVVAEAIKKLSLESKKVANSTRKEQDSLLKLLDDLLDISDTLEKKMSQTEDNINSTSATIEEISAKVKK